MRILIIILFISFSYTNQTNNDLLTKGYLDKFDKDFRDFILLIPQIKLPFQTYCENCCDHPKIDYDNKLIKRFIPEGSSVVGLFSIAENFVAILVTYPGDMIIPSIVTYDKYGKKLDEQGFMKNWCGREIDYLGLQYFKINDDYTITTIDTSYTFRMDSITDKIIDTIKIEITKNDYFINQKGKILKK